MPAAILWMAKCDQTLGKIRGICLGLRAQQSLTRQIVFYDFWQFMHDVFHGMFVFFKVRDWTGTGTGTVPVGG
jgi:hypothetical protein